MDEPNKGIRQVRIALVLYGGVSLAVYENGVTRCFYDLVRSRGVFKILRELLDASATIDVITGSSAGGINGLMLAAALESGQEFAPMTNLWRRLGDLGTLLRKPDEAHDAESLLNGQYFHDELIKSFESLCQVRDRNYQDPGEMDVFITGTDLDGHLRHYQDNLGRDIDDKEHRVVFHLQHRPGRKSLGIPKAKSEVNPHVQAKILGTIARITAGFPMAFPPVKGKIPDSEAQDALDRLSSIQNMKTRSLVDGGVLDNKPFGPLLRAIFYRMPEGIVDRRLFYVEPDPVPFIDQPKEEHTPLMVGFSSLVSIPGHEGIADDLEKLLEHNARVRWLKDLQTGLIKGQGQQRPGPNIPSMVYIKTRIESVARALVLDCDGFCSVGDFPRDSKSSILQENIRERLSARIKNNLPLLNAYDLAFHLRRTFHLLYDYYDDLKPGKAAPGTLSALIMLGRIIKTLKIILDHLWVLRDQLFIKAQGSDQKTADTILDEFMSFLASDAPHWEPLIPSLQGSVRLTAFEAKDSGFFNSTDLTGLTRKLREVKIDPLPEKPIMATILDRIAVLTEEIVQVCDGRNDRFTFFEFLDGQLYPLVFASGLYEMDNLEFVRISPADAQVGLSKNDPRAKVAGDELAHFSAFLRRDWRSNDILQGRFDGTCQIILSLFDREAMARALARAADLNPLFTREGIQEVLGKCPMEHIDTLCHSWQVLVAQYNRLLDKNIWPKDMEEAATDFQEQLILAGQKDALQEDIETIFTDLHFQEIKFGRSSGLRGAKAGAHEALIEADALQAAMQDMGHLNSQQRETAYQEMRLGAKDIVGSKGQVPNAVVGEYGSLAYLMFWGMLRRSLGHRADFLDKTRVKLFLRFPVQFMYNLFLLIRIERTTALALIMLTTGVLIGAAATALYLGQVFLFALAVLVLILGIAFSIKLLPKRWGTLAFMVITAAILLLAVAAVRYWPHWINALVRVLCLKLGGS